VPRKRNQLSFKRTAAIPIARVEIDPSSGKIMIITKPMRSRERHAGKDYFEVMIPRSALPLPRYVRRKLLKSGWGYFLDLPTRARKGGCTIAAEALGTDYAEAVERAERVLLPAFDSGVRAGRPTPGKPRRRGRARSIGCLASIAPIGASRDLMFAPSATTKSDTEWSAAAS
jgi:hypothetical protein